MGPAQAGDRGSELVRRGRAIMVDSPAQTGALTQRALRKRKRAA